MEKGIDGRDYEAFTEFCRAYLKKEYQGVFVRFGEQLYLLPPKAPSLRGLKVLRAGLHLGTMKKNRFEPSHAMALSLKEEEAKQSVSLSAAEPVLGSYLTGQTFPVADQAGWCLICTEGYSIGWGKAAGGIMKNHYPKGLRKNW